MPKLTVFTRQSPDFTNNAVSFVIFLAIWWYPLLAFIDEICDVMAVFVG
jgi:hypothetical protein